MITNVFYKPCIIMVEYNHVNHRGADGEGHAAVAEERRRYNSIITTNLTMYNYG